MIIMVMIMVMVLHHMAVMSSYGDTVLPMPLAMLASTADQIVAQGCCSVL
jgi:hypothetical protein